MRLAFFKATPDQVPAGRSTLTISVLLMVVANVLVTFTWYGFAGAMFLALVEVLLNGLFLYGCLTLQRHRSRFEQSLSAVCGMTAVMAIVAWPWALASKPSVSPRLTRCSSAKPVLAPAQMTPATADASPWNNPVRHCRQSVSVTGELEPHSSHALISTARTWPAADARPSAEIGSLCAQRMYS